jgi:hypothetical protein
MYKDYKIVIVTPAGRKRYLELLIPQIIKLRPIVDQYVLWVNTQNHSDLVYMNEVSNNNSDFIKLQFSDLPYMDGLGRIGSFCKQCIDKNTIYIRLDDDIIYIDGVEYLKEFLDFRINNPDYFLVYLNILNNGICSYIHQRLGNVGTEKGIVNYIADDRIGWDDPNFAKYLHETILNKDLDDFRFNKPWNLFNNELVSVNAICWLGSEFAKFNGEVDKDEERYLSVNIPKSMNKYNCIFGNFICIHYAFFTQRKLLDSTDILEQYKNKFNLSV